MPSIDRLSTLVSSYVASLFCVLLCLPAVGSAADPTCSLEYDLPAALPPGVTVPNQATDADFMAFSWRHFLALNAPAVDGQISLSGDNATQWSDWSSTADLFDAAHPGGSGSRFYPAACRKIPHFWRYRVLQQVGKVDDAFLEATTGGLSDDPVIDVDGNFLRYEILYSPAMYNEVIEQGLNKQSTLLELNNDINLSCGIETYTEGDPADAQMGAMMVKVAWRDAAGFSIEERGDFHVEDLLVFTPGYRHSSGKNDCELKPMAMVGMHIGHKTTKQPVWIWATFEHRRNAPDCLSQSPAPGSPGGASVNTSCPAGPLDVDYSFFPSDCIAGDACATCNTAPAPNGAPGQCDNPLDGDEDSWCVDLPPNPVAGTSQLCRQVLSFVCSDDVTTTCSVDADCDTGTCVPSYPAVPEQNAACWDAIAEGGDGGSVWLNYELIGSQWVAENFTACNNAVDSVITPPTALQTKPPGPVKNENLRELVVLNNDSTPIKRPLLGNTSMESYDRANCLGCHAKSYLGNFCENDRSLECSDDSDCTNVGGSCTQYSVNTDFVYSLKLEVAQQPGLLLPGSWLFYRDAPSWRKPSASLALSMQSSKTLLGLARSADDPRCNGAPWGTAKAFVGFVPTGFSFEDATVIELPCQGWQLRGHPSNPTGYEYRDTWRHWGPCQTVRIRADGGVTAQCSGFGVPDNLDAADGTLNVVVKTGSLRYCAQYGEFWQLGGRIALSKKNPPPALCALW